MACSDGLWHYFTPEGDLGPSLTAHAARRQSNMLVSKARQRARGTGDNISSLSLNRIEPLKD